MNELEQLDELEIILTDLENYTTHTLNYCNVDYIIDFNIRNLKIRRLLLAS